MTLTMRLEVSFINFNGYLLFQSRQDTYFFWKFYVYFMSAIADEALESHCRIFV